MIRRVVSFISFFIMELYCLVYSKRVAHGVMNSGVQLLSLFRCPFVLLFIAGI